VGQSIGSHWQLHNRHCWLQWNREISLADASNPPDTGDKPSIDVHAVPAAPPGGPATREAQNDYNPTSQCLSITDSTVTLTFHHASVINITPVSTSIACMLSSIQSIHFSIFNILLKNIRQCIKSVIFLFPIDMTWWSWTWASRCALH